MNEQQVIATYERIRDFTSQMLEAARHSDWDRLTSVERECRTLVDTLVSSEGGLRLSTPLQRRKVEIIRQVLADDAEIRKLTEPWMTQLEQLLGNVRNQRKLARAYDPDSPA